MPTPFLGRLLDSYRKKLVHFAFTFKDVFYRGAVIVFLATVMVWMSVFMYGVFYYVYMPDVSHMRPVDFKFKPCGEKPGLCTYPSAYVELTRRFSDQLLARGQPYRVVLSLDVPESHVNQNLGMFMVHISMLNKAGEAVVKSDRSAMLRYRSGLLRAIYTFCYAPMLVTGSWEEKQTVDIELVPNFNENAHDPTVAAYIELQTRFIEIYSASLHIHAHFHGLRFLMYHYPVLSAVCGVSMNMAFLLLLAAFSWHHWFLTPFFHQQSVVRIGFDDEVFARKPSTSLDARRAELKEKLEQRRLQAQLSMSGDIERIGMSGRRTQSFSGSAIDTVSEEIPWTAVRKGVSKEDLSVDDRIADANLPATVIPDSTNEILETSDESPEKDKEAYVCEPEDNADPLFPRKRRVFASAADS
ncbi:unnamed protein product [Notodromas monacha]|uniref:Seipin n=1 Tax=Notodromas monacha TaxID=399045 RepID=A0A7R9BHT2_9CRUS|nr:unnamed protein product [Notodromas monacha]CAG0914701.1 unnamed protein product [Notodromas monacha]